jgi:hypothetical protein
MSQSTYDPARQSAELLQSRCEFASPEYEIDLSDGIVTITHLATGEIGIYSAGRLSYGCSRVAPAEVSPSTRNALSEQELASRVNASRKPRK